MEISTDILPNDIKKVIQDGLALKQHYHEARKQQKEVGDMNDLLKQEVALSRDNEEREKTGVESLTQDVMKLQVSVRDLAEIKRENMDMRGLVKEYKNKVQELSNNLEKERLLCHELMQRNRKEFEEQTEKSLASAHSEMDNLRSRLMSTEEQLRKKSVEFQTKLRNAENDKNEEIRHITYDFQEKINKLQSALTATQTENRNIRDRLQFNTVAYQKKIQELERRSQLHPALRTAPQTANRGGKNLPRLNFLDQADLEVPETAPQSPEENQPEECQDAPQSSAPAAIRKRRKLFTQKNIPQ